MPGRPITLNVVVFVVFFMVLAISLRIFLEVPFQRAVVFSACVSLASFVAMFLLMNILSSRLR